MNEKHLANNGVWIYNRNEPDILYISIVQDNRKRKGVMKLTEANRLYKDRVFKFIFGNPENKEWTLSLYNAVNGSNYSNPDDIQFNTIEDAVYMSMKNDVSFIILDEMNLWEHQSSFNPNMPMRFLTYGTQLYEKFTATSGYYKFSRKLQRLPKPHCICFYNGTEEQPEQQVLKLSDAFGGEGDIEVKVKMLNVNYGKNRALLETCQPLREYAWLVDRVREHQRVMQNLEAAVDASIDEMPDSFVIRTLIEAHRAGVKKMFLTEYDEEKMKEQERKEAFADGVGAGVAEANERVAADMLKKKYPLDAIKDISRLSEAHIRKLAKSLGVVVL
jgi:hypothetical protein